VRSKPLRRPERRSTQRKVVCAITGEMIGVPELSPHDLRRTYTHLRYDAGVPLTQIKELLDHASVATTQKYLHYLLIWIILQVTLYRYRAIEKA
jgi:integrase